MDGLADDAWHAGEEATPTGERHFTLRLHVPGGLLSAEQLGVLCRIARQNGEGFVRLAPRFVIEVPGIRLSDLSLVQSALEGVGLTGGSTGTGLRHVVVCGSGDPCPHAFLDSRSLADSMDALLGGGSWPSPVRIAIASCPRACTAPQLADIGFMGTVDPMLDRARCTGCGDCIAVCEEKALAMRRGLPRRDLHACQCCGACVLACAPKALRVGRAGYTVYVGGQMGRRVQMGHVLARFVQKEEASHLAGRILAFFREYAEPRERLFSVIQRMGLEVLRSYVHSRPLRLAPTQST